MENNKIITNKQECIEISVIVSVYNVKEYLENCLRSLAEQSVWNVEFIIVDDGSTDGSSEICDDWALHDKRFIVIHQENRGLYLAREIGIEKSHGKRIVFLDGDDMLANEALSEMLKLIKNCDADIIQFSSIPFNCTSKKQFNELKHCLNSKNKSIVNNINIAKTIFVEKKINCTLWNKIFKSTVLKKTCIGLCNYRCTCAEDLYRMFLICFNANTFHSYKTKFLYYYRINSGITTKKQNINTFISHLQYNRIINDLNIFLYENNATDDWFNCLNSVKTYLYSSLIYIMSNFTGSEFQQSFQLFYNKYDIIDCLPWIEQAFIEKQNKLVAAYSSLIKNIKIDRNINNLNNKKTIGIFYHRYYNGGIERVISLQIPLFIKLGYKIVLFTEEINKQLEYNLPPGIIRVQLPESYTQNRANILLSAIKKYNISTMCHHATSSIYLLFDLILLREARVHIVLIAHEMTCCYMSLKVKYQFDRVAVYKLSNILLTLSTSEETFYKLCGINACYIPNPVINLNRAEIVPINERNLSILWIGRLSTEKNYKDSLRIFRLILRKRNDVRCYIIGSGKIIDSIYVYLFIKLYRLSGKIIHIPYTKNVDIFYKKSYIHLVTSSFESFPMVIVESKLYGLPLVTYNLPTVELLKDGLGCVRVERHNIQEAADAVLEILENKEYAERLSNEARESIEPFLQCDQEQIWSDILSGNCRTHTKILEGETDNMCLFWSSLITMYHDGLVSKPSIRQRFKTIIKFILTFFLPVGSKRRHIAGKIYRSAKMYLKIKCRDIVNELSLLKK